MTGKQKILDSAYELFCESNFDAVSIRDIGARAGMTNPALYQHFNSKAALAEMLYIQCYERLLASVDKHAQQAILPFDRVESYIRGSVALHQARHSPLLFLEDYQRQFGLRVRELYGERAISIRLSSWLLDGQSVGAFRTDVSAEAMTALCIGQVTKWAMMHSMGVAGQEDAPDGLIALVKSAIQNPESKAGG